MEDYYQSIIRSRDALAKRVDELFKKSNYKLLLSLQDYNLLEDADNCIATSTVIGYVIEEYIVSHLVGGCRASDCEPFKVKRRSGATTKDSYDCWFENDAVRFLVNVKAEKEGGSNDAVAAIKQLYNDYCESEPDVEKSYIVIKAKYKISEVEISDGQYQRCIEVTGVDAYCLEEIELVADAGGFSQDHRNWSVGGNNLNNGRLRISSAFRRKHRLTSERVSYSNTKTIISEIFCYNNKE